MRNLAAKNAKGAKQTIETRVLVRAKIVRCHFDRRGKSFSAHSRRDGVASVRLQKQFAQYEEHEV